METILFLIIIGLLVFIAIRVSDIYSLQTKKKLSSYIDDTSVIKTDEPVDDEDYINAKDYVISTGNASTSSLQTSFRWGYNKASRILNELEQFGVIGSAKQGERYRKILNKEDKK